MVATNVKLILRSSSNALMGGKFKLKLSREVWKGPYEPETKYAKKYLAIHSNTIEIIHKDQFSWNHRDT